MVTKKKRLKLPSLYTIINWVLLFAVGFVMLYPFWYVLMYSLSTYSEVVTEGAIMVPHGFTLQNIKIVLQNSSISRGYLNSLFLVTVGTTLSVVVTAMLAYPLSQNVMGTKAINLMIYFTMLFGGGMIPTYYVVRATGILNTLWSLILPSLVGAYNVFMMRNFFRNIPSELIESAALDGSSSMNTLFRIVLPLSLPIFATITLYYAVGYWNRYFDAILYIRSASKRPLQVALREMISMSMSELLGQGSTSDASKADLTGSTIQKAAIVVTILPIMCIYPFLQKYFTKGTMSGAVKS